ncbi:CAP domain-containing protein [Strongyloides ratti]|uniref:CAP domain-containing protein n=1 Tax=Strongyloides ratti TaxID=34506 RepID=A0A090LLP5_STRRB|nr:CAP domain-containing protein [Strongyloides ratti]CEF70646.2 CAP domain-containing protein [Strongyloides ratti]
MKYLLDILLHVVLFTIFLKAHKTSLKQRKSSSNNVGESSRLPDDPFKVTYYLLNIKVFYECNGFVFTEHSNVMHYYKQLTNSLFKNKKIKPKGGQRIDITKFQNVFKIAEYSYNSVIRKNPFSSKIWNTIWYTCDYFCYSFNNFNALKVGLFNEINEYRRVHGVHKLTEHVILSRIAEKEAIHSSKQNKNSKCSHKWLGCYIFIYNKFEANKIIKPRYNIFLSEYKWNNNRQIADLFFITQCIWKKTKSIGIGVQLKGNYIYVVFTFLPKGNVNGEYLRNVQPISEKVIHMYNLFKNHL